MGVHHGNHDGAEPDYNHWFLPFMLKLNLVDTYIPLIIPCIAAPAVVFFMKQYMESTLSIEMIEAARIDGAREFRISIPLSCRL